MKERRERLYERQMNDEKGANERVMYKCRLIYKNKTAVREAI